MNVNFLFILTVPADRSGRICLLHERQKLQLSAKPTINSWDTDARLSVVLLPHRHNQWSIIHPHPSQSKQSTVETWPQLEDTWPLSCRHLTTILKIFDHYLEDTWPLPCRHFTITCKYLTTTLKTLLDHCLVVTWPLYWRYVTTTL